MPQRRMWTHMPSIPHLQFRMAKPSDTWQSPLMMPETINSSRLLAGRMPTCAGWELSSTLQTAQLDQEKGFLKQLNRFIVQHFPSLHNIKKKKKFLGFFATWSWKVAPASCPVPPSQVSPPSFLMGCKLLSPQHIYGGELAPQRSVGPGSHSKSLCIYTFDNSSQAREGVRGQEHHFQVSRSQKREQQGNKKMSKAAVPSSCSISGVDLR